MKTAAQRTARAPARGKTRTPAKRKAVAKKANGKAVPGPLMFFLIRGGEIIQRFETLKEAETSGRRRFRDGDFLALEFAEADRVLADYAKRQEAQLDLNFAAFEKKLDKLAKKHLDSYVLMRNGRMYGFYSSWQKAAAEARKRWKDGIFSAPQIDNRVYDVPTVEVVE